MAIPFSCTSRRSRPVERRTVYAFGSSTPRFLPYLNQNVPRSYLAIDAKFRRNTRSTGPSLSDYMRDARRETSPIRIRRDRSLDSSLHRRWAFGSSTPRELSYLCKIKPEYRVYDVRLEGIIDDGRRSITTTNIAPTRNLWTTPKTIFEKSKAPKVTESHDEMPEFSEPLSQPCLSGVEIKLCRNSPPDYYFLDEQQSEGVRIESISVQNGKPIESPDKKLDKKLPLRSPKKEILTAKKKVGIASSDVDEFRTDLPSEKMSIEYVAGISEEMKLAMGADPFESTKSIETERSDAKISPSGQLIMRKMYTSAIEPLETVESSISSIDLEHKVESPSSPEKMSAKHEMESGTPNEQKTAQIRSDRSQSEIAQIHTDGNFSSEISQMRTDDNFQKEITQLTSIDIRKVSLVEGIKSDIDGEIVEMDGVPIELTELTETNVEEQSISIDNDGKMHVYDELETVPKKELQEELIERPTEKVGHLMEHNEQDAMSLEEAKINNDQEEHQIDVTMEQQERVEHTEHIEQNMPFGHIVETVITQCDQPTNNQEQVQDYLYQEKVIDTKSEKYHVMEEHNEQIDHEKHTAKTQVSQKNKELLAIDIRNPAEEECIEDEAEKLFEGEETQILVNNDDEKIHEHEKEDKHFEEKSQSDTTSVNVCEKISKYHEHLQLEKRDDKSEFDEKLSAPVLGEKIQKAHVVEEICEHHEIIENLEPEVAGTLSTLQVQEEPADEIIYVHTEKGEHIKKQFQLEEARAESDLLDIAQYKNENLDEKICNHNEKIQLAPEKLLTLEEHLRHEEQLKPEEHLKPEEIHVVAKLNQNFEDDKIYAEQEQKVGVQESYQHEYLQEKTDEFHEKQMHVKQEEQQFETYFEQVKQVPEKLSEIEDVKIEGQLDQPEHDFAYKNEADFEKKEQIEPDHGDKKISDSMNLNFKQDEDKVEQQLGHEKLDSLPFETAHSSQPLELHTQLSVQNLHHIGADTDREQQQQLEAIQQPIPVDVPEAGFAKHPSLFARKLFEIRTKISGIYAFKTDLEKKSATEEINSIPVVVHDEIPVMRNVESEIQEVEGEMNVGDVGNEAHSPTIRQRLSSVIGNVFKRDDKESSKSSKDEIEQMNKSKLSSSSSSRKSSTSSQKFVTDPNFQSMLNRHEFDTI